MKILVKKDDKYLNVSWIDRLSNGSIIGWHLESYDSSKNFPENIEFLDIHYHYPRIGKFHFSYKYTINNLKYHIRAYSEELNIKVLGNIQMIKSSELFFPQINKFEEFFFVDGSHNISYEDPLLYKELTIHGFRLPSKRILNKLNQYGKKLRPKENDIILDIDTLGDV